MNREIKVRIKGRELGFVQRVKTAVGHLGTEKGRKLGLRETEADTFHCTQSHSIFIAAYIVR